jgi:hypothetical protein
MSSVVKKTFSEYTEGRIFATAFDQSLGYHLTVNEINHKNTRLMANKMEIPYNNEKLLSLFLTKEELGNDINKYVESFGLGLLSTAKVMFDNLSEIHENVNKTLKSRYAFYEMELMKDVLYDKHIKSQLEEEEIEMKVNELEEKIKNG